MVFAASAASGLMMFFSITEIARRTSCLEGAAAAAPAKATSRVAVSVRLRFDMGMGAPGPNLVQNRDPRNKDWIVLASRADKPDSPDNVPRSQRAVRPDGP